MLPILIKNDSIVNIFVSLLLILSLVSSSLVLRDKLPNSFKKFNEKNDSSIKVINEIHNQKFERLEKDFNKEAVYNKTRRNKVNDGKSSNKIMYNFRRTLNKKLNLPAPWHLPIISLRLSLIRNKSNAPQETFDQLSDLLHNQE